MATKRVLLGGQMLAIDDETGEVMVRVTGLTFDKDIDMGDVNLLNIAGEKINPATQETLAAILAKIIAAPATEAQIGATTNPAAGTTNKLLTDLLAKATPLAAAANGGSAVSITNGSAQVAAANASRKSLTVINRSTTAMLTLNLGGTAVSGAGACLSPAVDATHPGGNTTITDYTGIVNGIMSVADATAGNVAVVEV